MVVTNILGLPQPIVAAVTLSPHNKEGCYSATTLLKGTREIILSKRYWDKLSVDAADNIWALFGTAVHSVLESQNTEEFKEERFSVKISNSLVTGQVDCYDMAKGILCDYKTASVWKVQFKDFSDWHMQGMIYAYLMSEQGLTVNRCRFIALLKDHSKSKAKVDASYPQSPVVIYEFEVTPEDLHKTKEFIIAKVKALEEAETLPDDKLPLCTDDERWADNAKWACYKGANKKATKLFDNEKDATEYASVNGLTVVYRPPVARKCTDYCYACQFCSQYKAEHEES